MRYFRRHLGFGRLGLLALAVQLVVSFGHVHAEPDHEIRVAHAELFGEHREVVADVAVISEPTEHHHESPADSDGSDESCSVCATKAQANYMVLQGALVIAFPRVPLTLSSLDQADACISDKSASQFQAWPPIKSLVAL